MCRYKADPTRLVRLPATVGGWATPAAQCWKALFNASDGTRSHGGIRLRYIRILGLRLLSTAAHLLDLNKLGAGTVGSQVGAGETTRAPVSAASAAPPAMLQAPTSPPRLARGTSLLSPTMSARATGATTTSPIISVGSIKARSPAAAPAHDPAAAGSRGAGDHTNPVLPKDRSFTGVSF